MNDERELREQLRALAAPGESPGMARLQTAAGEVCVVLQDCDRHSALVDHIAARGPAGELGQLAAALASHVRELDEPLALLEIEPAEGLAIMRSAAPQRDAAGVEYWEAELRPGRLRLARFRKDHQAPERAPQPTPMLHGQLARLASELAAALEQPA